MSTMICLKFVMACYVLIKSHCFFNSIIESFLFFPSLKEKVFGFYSLLLSLTTMKIVFLDLIWTGQHKVNLITISFEISHARILPNSLNKFKSNMPRDSTNFKLLNPMPFSWIEFTLTRNWIEIYEKIRFRVEVENRCLSLYIFVWF